MFKKLVKINKIVSQWLLNYCLYLKQPSFAAQKSHKDYNSTNRYKDTGPADHSEFIKSIFDQASSLLRDKIYRDES